MFGRTRHVGKDAALGAHIVAEGAPIRRAADDDLLTAGLGLAGLRRETPPPEASLRQISIHREFRELVDVTDEGGYARLYGPARAEDIVVLGSEITTLLRLPGRTFPFVVRVLIPDTFDRDDPCLIVAPSSGSRGVTGAIGDIGGWALTHGCALVLTDKGTGVGGHILATDDVYDANYAMCRAGAGPTTFEAKRSRALTRFIKANPHAVALKHAHSRENVEADAPYFVLAAARYGVRVLRAHLEGRAGERRISVIAAGVSNGGGAVLRAAEEDTQGVLDAIVAVEPNVTPRVRSKLDIIDGVERCAAPGRALYDIASAMTLLAPVAALAPSLGETPLAELTAPLSEAHAVWAKTLAGHGLIEGMTTEDRALSALQRLRALGFGPQSDACLHAMVALQIWPAVAATFANALGRFGVEDALGGVTFAFADPGSLAARAPTSEERKFFAARGAGLAPSAGVELIDNDRAAGMSVETALRFRALWTERDRQARRIQRGARDVLASARLRGAPTIIVHGRGDSLININHASRAYVAAAHGPGAHNLRYYEVDNAQHFETLLMTPGFSSLYAPLNAYAYRALALMRTTLRDGSPLPPSQRVRTSPPAPTVDGMRAQLENDHLGPIQDAPGARDAIELSRSSLIMPTN